MCVSGMGVCAMRVSTGVMTELLGRQGPAWGLGDDREKKNKLGISPPSSLNHNWRDFL